MSREDYPAYVIFVAVTSVALCLLSLFAGAGWAALAFPLVAGLALVVGWWMQ